MGNLGKQGRTLALVILVLLGSIYLILARPPKLGLDLRGGAQLTLQARPNPKQGIPEVTPRLLEAAKFVVEQRINGLGVSESTVQISGSDRIIVQLPGVNDPAQAERVLGSTAQLDFRTQKPGTEATYLARRSEQREILFRKIQAEAAKDADAIAKAQADLDKNYAAIGEFYQPSGITGDALIDAREAPLDAAATNWQVSISLNQAGGEKFAQITKQLAGTGRLLGIFLDDKPITEATVEIKYRETGISGGQVSISGNFNQTQATDLALQLRAGALPIPVTLVENRTVGASLGADSVQASIYAGVAGLILVLIFMVLYYRLPGIIADLALIIYATLTFALFSILGVTLSLPGIAGFILSIGMAVDANVLIFERTKEELKSGRTLYKSVEAGFNRAWTSILDGHVTSLIACGALFWLGAGLVKGFAVTLTVGIFASLFTAITCSRAFLLIAIANPSLRQPQYFGVKSFGKKVKSSLTAPDPAIDQTSATL
ncbi:MAG: protein translocase subunit SecD [Pseudanabaenaceae cyanobacterium bins.68]|nr:protein translocase subunit SecD [Pseudanabaenaceae cyanobacterium bins.68]